MWCDIFDTFPRGFFLEHTHAYFFTSFLSTKISLSYSFSSREACINHNIFFFLYRLNFIKKQRKIQVEITYADGLTECPQKLSLSYVSFLVNNALLILKYKI